MSHFRLRLLVGMIASLTLLGSSARGQDAALQARIQQKAEYLRNNGMLTLDGSTVAAVRFIPAFYKQRQFRPAWTNRANVDALLAAVRASEQEGLDPSDFHQKPLLRLYQEIQQDGKTAEADRLVTFDLLLTDSLLRIAYQLFYGKVDPQRLDPTWNFDRPLVEKSDVVAEVEQAVESGNIATFLQDTKLKHPLYAQFKSALAYYRAIRQVGGWQPLAAGPVLKPGMDDPRVAALRRRLAVTGDYAATAGTNANLFDADVERAVKAFQARHGLASDALVGPETLTALNVPVEARIDQLRVNMERARWILRNLDDDFVIVNIAGFHTYLVKDGQTIWEARAMVGRPYRKTPVFKGRMTYLEFNPTWTVPPTILRQDVLPKIQKDPAYLARQNFSVVDRNGRSVDPASIHWASVSPGRFPYQIVQAPGPTNALGLIKFMLPNKHLIYLHDTPSRELFKRPERTFSSGCIRVERPFELAEMLLRGQDGWSRERIEAIVQTGKTQRVSLTRPIPVLLLYWTADVDAESGSVQFMKDVYNRDGLIREALEGEFTPTPLPDLW